MKEARSSYPMSVDERDQIERELDEFGYRETHDPDIAERRRSTRSRGGTLTSCTSKRSSASNDLTKAKAILAAEKTP